jgi:4-hydroxybenzoate polyprenyltransferase
MESDKPLFKNEESFWQGRFLPKDLGKSAHEYISIARPDHWFKNIFMLPGTALALVIGGNHINNSWSWYLCIGIIATCAIASANYTINEWLDAEFDRYHPKKKYRPSVNGQIKAKYVYLQWILLSITGIWLSSLISIQFLLTALALLIMGLVYNVKPIRSKDRLYLDVLSESINNPLRFMLGWFVVLESVLPPSSILFAYWMGGAFLMAVKRYAEYRYIGDPASAGRYRRSFIFYTEDTLLLSAFFYALTSAFFLGVFLLKYRVEFILTMPFFALLFVWYLKIGLKTDSVTQRPEKLFSEKKYIAFVLLLSAQVTILYFVDIPWLDILVDYHVLE